MQTGERQTARLRLRYLKAVLKQDMSFFDTEAEKTNLVFHISSDAILVQDAIGDKVCYIVLLILFNSQNHNTFSYRHYQR